MFPSFLKPVDNLGPEPILFSSLMLFSQNLTETSELSHTITRDAVLSLTNHAVYYQFSGCCKQTHTFQMPFEWALTFKMERMGGGTVWKLGRMVGLTFGRGEGEGTITFRTEEEAVLERWRRELSARVNRKGYAELIFSQRQIGSGHTATVFEALQLEQQRLVAVKIMKKSDSNPKINAAIINQIQTLRKMKPHPNLVGLYQVFEQGDSYMLVMQYLRGGSLLSFRSLRKRLTYSQLQTLLRGIICGLLQLHRLGYIHRDLKPQNIVLRSSITLQPVICDFGLMTNCSSPNYIYVRCGTPGYIAPEIIHHVGVTGQSQISDVFSLGVLLHALVFGYSPFTATEVKKVMKLNSECSVDWSASRFRRLDAELVTLMKRMMRKDPRGRIRAEELLAVGFFRKDYGGRGNCQADNLELAEPQKGSGEKATKRCPTRNPSGNSVSLVTSRQLLKSPIKTKPNKSPIKSQLSKSPIKSPLKSPIKSQLASPHKLAQPLSRNSISRPKMKNHTPQKRPRKESVQKSMSEMRGAKQRKIVKLNPECSLVNTEAHS